VGEFDWSRLFKPSPLAFRESAHKRSEAGLMVFTVKLSLVPSSERSLDQKVKEATQRVSLENNASDNLSVSGTRLVF
jgi:hypothetical protein